MKYLLWIGAWVAVLNASTALGQQGSRGPAAPARSNVAVMLVDTDRPTGDIDERIYGQFLEHINHSVEDGLYAEQIRGQGFEGKDFKTYWEPFSDRGQVEIADIDFQNG